MIQIDETIITLDFMKAKFCCDLAACMGECCIEGDAGAPVLEVEVAELEKVLPIIEKDLRPEAQDLIKKQGVVYVDEDGELVTSIVNGKDCVFTCYDEKGCCFCAIEKAYREGRVNFQKPISCFLYPARLKDFHGNTAINYHRWNVCKAAELKGEAENIPLYQFLKEPLIKRFGEAWYKELGEAYKELKIQGYLND